MWGRSQWGPSPTAKPGGQNRQNLRHPGGYPEGSQAPPPRPHQMVPGEPAWGLEG